MKALSTGGGTAGYLIPLLAIVSELRKLSEENKIDKLQLSLRLLARYARSGSSQ